ncbi:hypothetical protein CspeluHIS016_0802370 [Cutaneotrichosporon spelunceum]|uniref:Uncharacterized protein n=1 Tax=Cutaneotrichosporon spelunceum TaxID=1672016 RepID=A0AAD3YDY6_9TREE|nr:hypothetical protein CspeluHIS016_0802370 [Cutaneotrichosporon spelunceum]
MSVGVGVAQPPPLMRQEAKQRIEHPYSFSALSPPPRSSSRHSTLCSPTLPNTPTTPNTPASVHGTRHDSVITVNSSTYGSTVSFPSTAHSNYTSSSSAFHRPTDLEESDEDLLASAWRHPLAVHAEPVPAMPLHVEEMRTRRARGGVGTWHIPSAETLCAQIGHDASPRLHRCFLNAFMVPVASYDHFATTRCKRCGLAIVHDDESCKRCPAHWLRAKTGVDETAWLGTRSRLVIDERNTATANRLLSPQTSHVH